MLPENYLCQYNIVAIPQVAKLVDILLLKNYFGNWSYRIADQKQFWESLCMAAGSRKKEVREWQ